MFAPLPAEPDEAADVPLAEIGGLETATVAVLEAGGYRTLNDIIDLERDDLLRLPGIAPAEADRIMAIIDELTTDDATTDQSAEGAGSAPEPQG
jgi:N utilization substance protein A